MKTDPQRLTTSQIVVKVFVGLLLGLAFIVLASLAFFAYQMFTGDPR